jgi:predicted TIM-barrel fold metal-dependent hydrolase
MLIELHGHIMLPNLINRHPHWGPFFEQDEQGFLRTRVGDWTLCTVTQEQQAASKAGSLPKLDIKAVLERRFSVPAVLAQMDGLGIDKLVISMGTPYLMYWAEPQFNIGYAQLVNETFAAYCAGAPERLYFWGHLPLQAPKAAVQELERAVRLGARGFSVGGSRFGGIEIHDRALYPLWERLCDANKPLFVHAPNLSADWGEGARQEPFDTTSVLGMPYDESCVFWKLITGGVLDDFPTLKIYITHGGGMVPFQLGRLAALNEVLLSARNRRPLCDYLSSFYFDLLVHGAPMRQAIVDTIGAHRIVYGSSMGGSDGVREDLTRGLRLSPEDREKIRWDNASRLLDIPLNTE